MPFVRLYVRTAALVSLTLGACACPSANRSAAMAPPSPPALQQPAPPAPVAAQPTQSQVAPKEEESAQKSAAPEVVPAPNSVADPIADLIARVEKEYQEGLDNYHAGKADDAKENFDNALNDLLVSNFDVRSDDRLGKEFERIVQGVNGLYPGGTSAEVEAAQDQQQKAEPAPIDETNGLAPTADAGTKAKVEAQLRQTHSDLPLMMTDQVAGYITYFSGHGRGVFERAYARSGRYRDMIISTLKEEGV